MKITRRQLRQIIKEECKKVPNRPGWSQNAEWIKQNFKKDDPTTYATYSEKHRAPISRHSLEELTQEFTSGGNSLIQDKGVISKIIKMKVNDEIEISMQAARQIPDATTIFSDGDVKLKRESDECFLAILDMNKFKPTESVSETAMKITRRQLRQIIKEVISDDQDFETVSDDEFAAISQAAYDRMAKGYHSDNPESIDAHVDPHYGYPKTVGYTDPKGEDQVIVVNSLDDMNDILDLLTAQDIPYSVD